MTRPRRRFRGRLLTLLVAVSVLAPSISTEAGLPTQNSRAGQTEPGRGDRSQPGDRVSIKLIEQDAVVAPDGNFTVFVEVDGAPAGSDLAIDIYPVVDELDLLDDAVSGDLRNSEATFPVVDLPPQAGSTPVHSGFSISLYGRGQQSPGGGWAKRLTEPGVYPVRVRLRGPDNQTMKTLVTFLVRSGDADDDDDEMSATMVALVPELTLDASPAERVGLSSEPLSPDEVGRVETLIDIFADHPDVPASFSVPPELARRLAIPTSEPADRSDPPPGGNNGSDGTATEPSDVPPSDPSPDVVEATVVERFRAVLEGDDRELLGAPFVDIDPTELVSRGLEAELSRQQSLGFRDLAAVLEPPVGDTWSVTRRLDADTVDTLADLGVNNLLVPPTTFRGPAPDLPVRVEGTSGGSRLLAADPALSTGGTSDPALAAHRLLAQTVARGMLGDQGPQLVTVPPLETVDDVAALDALLILLSQNEDLVQATTVSQLLRSSMSEAGRTSLTSPDLGSRTRYPNDLRDTRALVDSYASMTPERSDLSATLGERLSRSAAADLPLTARTTVVEEVRASVEAEFAAVTIPESDRVTLGARDAQFPLVISSKSPVPLKVLVTLTSASDRLTVKQESIEVALDGDRTEVPVRVHSRSPGDTPIRIVVSTLDGQVILSEGSYSVRSTAVSGVGLLLTVGAGLFLAVWWGRHFLRSRRSRARHAR